NALSWSCATLSVILALPRLFVPPFKPVGTAGSSRIRRHSTPPARVPLNSAKTRAYAVDRAGRAAHNEAHLYFGRLPGWVIALFPGHRWIAAGRGRGPRPVALPPASRRAAVRRGGCVRAGADRAGARPEDARGRHRGRGHAARLQPDGKPRFHRARLPRRARLA